MVQLRVTRRTAETLVRHADPQTIRNWLKVIKDDESIQDRSAYLVKALREEWQLPESFHRKEAKQREAELKEQDRKRRESYSICQGQGFYQVAKNTVALCKHNGLKKTAEEKGHELLESGPIWDQVAEKLIGQIPRSTHQRLKDIKLLGIDEDTAFIGCTDQLTKDWLYM
jgi:hypothetical protein